MREAADADAVIGACAADVIQAGPKIRWMQHLYAGVERCLAIPGFVDRRHRAHQHAEGRRPVMSEHVLAFMFGLARGFATYVPLQSKGEWKDEAVPESRMWSVEGRTMLVVGLERHRHGDRAARKRTRHEGHRDPEFRHRQAALCG